MFYFFLLGFSDSPGDLRMMDMGVKDSFMTWNNKNNLEPQGQPFINGWLSIGWFPIFT